jgi:hypothetical protein
MMKGIFIAGVLSVLPVAAFAQVQQSSQSNGQSTSTAVVETGGGDGRSPDNLQQQFMRYVLCRVCVFPWCGFRCRL